MFIRPSLLMLALITTAVSQSARTFADDFQYSNNSDTHFSGKDLSGADFEYSVISDAFYTKANLKNAKLNYTVAACADFTSAKLSGAELKYSVASDARFTNADCRGADFSYSILTDADFSGADIRGARFSSSLLFGRFSKQTIYDETTRFPSGFDPKERGLTLKSRTASAKKANEDLAAVVTALKKIVEMHPDTDAAEKASLMLRQTKRKAN